LANLVSKSLASAWVACPSAINEDDLHGALRKLKLCLSSKHDGMPVSTFMTQKILTQTEYLKKFLARLSRNTACPGRT
jgi:hypothetical protein